MLDDIRKEAAEPLEQENTPPPKPFISDIEEKKILGMNARQRFIISLLLLIVICLLGSVCLLLTGKIAI